MSESQLLFFEAIGRGDQPAAALQLDANPDLLTSTDTQGASPVLFACYRGQMPIAEWLADRKANLLLPEALVLGRRGVVLALLAADPQAARSHCADGFSMLGLAVFFGRLDCCSLRAQTASSVATMAAARSTWRAPRIARACSAFWKRARFRPGTP